MSIIQSDLLLGQEGSSKYQVSRSLRFDGGSYLSRTPGSAGSRTTWTWSGWIKRSALGSQQTFFDGYSDGSNRTQLMFESDNTIRILNLVGGSVTTNLITTAVFRDASAWYHVVIAWDTTQGTSSNRVKVYINGTQQTTFSTATYPGSSENSFINAVNAHDIGRTGAFAEAYFSGYLAECHFIDGSAKVPGDFAETDSTTGQWIPKLYSGSYGTNGFKLTFADNSAATAAALGKDTSGNSPANNWTPNNFGITNYVNYSAGWNNNAVQPTKSFDGSTSGEDGTYAVVGATASWSGNIPCTGTVRMYVKRQSNTAGDTLTVNGTSVIPSAGTDAWVDITTAAGSAITSIQTYRASSASFSVTFIMAIEVNGTVLVNNTGAGNDLLVDTPTSYGTDTGAGGEVRGNYATLNPLSNGAAGTLSNGNLDLVTGSSEYGTCTSTIGVSAGKWYAEFTVNSGTPVLGIVGTLSNSTTFQFKNQTDGWAYLGANGTIQNNNTVLATYSTFTTGDIIGIAIDKDNNKLYFAKNGTWQNSADPGAGTNGISISGVAGLASFLAVGDNDASGTVSVSLNTGQRAFAYTNNRSGFKALVDTNLTAPVIAKPSTVMDVKLYTGNGSTNNITGLGFSPDLVWIKSRSSGTYWHELLDSVRGANKSLFSNATNAEETRTNRTLNSDGFTVVWGSADDNGVNANSATYAAWTWDAGTSTVTNTQGSITSQVRANASAGFSIATYTGNGVNGSSFGHGLGVKPEFLIIKSLGVGNWFVWHKSLPSEEYRLSLDSTSGQSSLGVAFWYTLNSSILEMTSNAPFKSGAHVMYSWASVAGYSSFGSYVGNGSSDGPFQWCGFRPRWVLYKESSVAGSSWEIIDAARNPYNASNARLFPDSSGAENTAQNALDLLSNGFKPRATYGGNNASGATYIWAAFAESPFQYARAR